MSERGQSQKKCLSSEYLFVYFPVLSDDPVRVCAFTVGRPVQQDSDEGYNVYLVVHSSGNQSGLFSGLGPAAVCLVR